MLSSTLNYARVGGQPQQTFSSMQNAFGNASSVYGSQQQQQQQQPGQQLDPLLQGADPNSPEIFKNSIQVLHQQVGELQKLARRVLLSIQNAYQYGNSPAHTEADINTLKQMLSNIIEKLRASGVGALPIHPQVVDNHNHQPQPFANEEQMMASTTASLRAVYDQLHKSRESASVVANLLTTDYASRPGVPMPK